MTPEDRVLDHYEHPYHQHTPPVNHHSPLLTGEVESEVCRDYVECWIRVTSERVILGVWWKGHGCCFSQAAASMVAKYLEDKTLKEAKAFTQGNMLALFGIDIEPERIECVMVALNALQKALEKHHE